MKDNFFKIDRKIFDSCVFRNEIDFRLFFYLMGNAVFSKDGVKQTETLTIQRGQYQRSLDNLVDDLYFVENKKIKKYPKSSLRASIKRLEKFNMISCEKHELGTIFTLVNYAKYQDKKGFEEDNIAPNHAQYPHNDGTVSAQYPHHNKNDKNDKNEKNDKNDKNKELTVVAKAKPKELNQMNKSISIESAIDYLKEQYTVFSDDFINQYELYLSTRKHNKDLISKNIINSNIKSLLKKYKEEKIMIEALEFAVDSGHTGFFYKFENKNNNQYQNVSQRNNDVLNEIIFADDKNYLT